MREQTFDEVLIGRGFLESPVGVRDTGWPERPQDSSPGSSDAVARTQGQDAREVVVSAGKGEAGVAGHSLPVVAMGSIPHIYRREGLSPGDPD